MFILDANILIYAFRRDAPQHPPCRVWLSRALADGEDVSAPSVAELALLRIATLPSLGTGAAPPKEVFAFLTDLRRMGYRRLEPGGDHDRHLHRLCEDLGLRGNDVNDAFLAALAFEHNATLVSADRGFGRFPGLSWFDPLAPDR